MARSEKIAYLLSQYPAVSHTFFMTEVLALRQLGFRIETASINGIAPPVDGFPATEQHEAQRTFYIKSMPKLRVVASLGKTLLRRPAVAWRGLRAVFTLSTPISYRFFYWIEALLLGEWMAQTGCTHLHVHFAGPVATVGLLTSIAWDIPFSLSVHGPDDFYNVQNYHLRRKVEHAKFVCCISHFCRSQLLRLVPGETWGKFHVCRLGVDTEVFRPSGPTANSEFRIVSVGRLHPSKGQAVLLSAISMLRTRGIQVHLDLVGGGKERSFLEAFIAGAQLSHMVTLHGATSHKRTRALLEKADLFVLSSFAEGLPVALMEAMAAGKPCICSMIAGVPELITNSTEGVLVAPADEAGLADAIERLILDPDLRRTISEHGRAKVIADYEIGKNTQRLAEVFRSYGLGEVSSA